MKNKTLPAAGFSGFERSCETLCPETHPGPKRNPRSKARQKWIRVKLGTLIPIGYPGTSHLLQRVSFSFPPSYAKNKAESKA